MRTDSTGLFEFGDIPEGGYMIQVRRDGYKTRTIPAHVPAAGAVELIAAMDSIMTDRDKRFENRLRAFALAIAIPKLQSRAHTNTKA